MAVVSGKVAQIFASPGTVPDLRERRLAKVTSRTETGIPLPRAAIKVVTTKALSRDATVRVAALSRDVTDKADIGREVSVSAETAAVSGKVLREARKARCLL